jgi:hypothetical protein
MSEQIKKVCRCGQQAAPWDHRCERCAAREREEWQLFIFESWLNASIPLSLPQAELFGEST